MKDREQIWGQVTQVEGRPMYEAGILETLLDCRDLLSKLAEKKERPKKTLTHEVEFSDKEKEIFKEITDMGVEEVFQP